MIRNDLDIYDKFGSEWWDPNSKNFSLLQSITPFRVGLITKYCGEIKNCRVLDLGCGGGLISVPLLDLGAQVCGIDRSEASIVAARKKACGRGDFIVADVNQLELENETWDLVILADFLEHVPDYNNILKIVNKLLVPGGKVFISTVNRNFLADLIIVRLFENIGLIPKGTHDPNLFIKPKELIESARKNDFIEKKVIGEGIDLFSLLFRWKIILKESCLTQIVYSMFLEKKNEN